MTTKTKTWEYCERTSPHSPEEAENRLQEALNEDIKGYCYKFGSSNRHGGDSRAVAFYCDEEITIPNSQPTTSTAWVVKHFSSNDLKDVYPPMIKFLNSLTNYQMFYAQIAVTNGHGNKLSGAVWYPKG